jgi:hypothetical protein
MPVNDPWLASRLFRALFLISAIIAGSLIGNLFLGAAGSLIGAGVGFIVVIEKTR